MPEVWVLISSDSQANKIRYLLLPFSEQIRISKGSKLFMRKRKLPIICGHKLRREIRINQSSETQTIAFLGFKQYLSQSTRRFPHLWSATDTATKATSLPGIRRALLYLWMTEKPD